MSSELSEFFKLLAEEKKKKNEEFKSTAATGNESIFASMDWEEVSR